MDWTQILQMVLQIMTSPMFQQAVAEIMAFIQSLVNLGNGTGNQAQVDAAYQAMMAKLQA